MAAGLPQITTDWDEMRDTVSEDVGIRVPTRSLPVGHGAIDAWGISQRGSPMRNIATISVQ